MLMMARVPLAFGRAGAAGGDAGLELRLHERQIGLGQPRDHRARGLAHIRAVEIEADAAPQLVDLLLAKTGIGAEQAALGAAEAGLDASGEQIQVARAARMGSDEILDIHGHSSRVRQLGNKRSLTDVAELASGPAGPAWA